MFDVRIAPDPSLRTLLEKHPRIGQIQESPALATMEWDQGDWHRSLFVAHPEIPLHGVVELTDNNPLVCADAFSVPGPAATLAVLALGPLSDAGLIVERPTMLINVETDEEEVAHYLSPLGWDEGLTIGGEPTDLGGAIAATVICAIKTPPRLEDIDDLFDERYGRSFYVRLDDASDWHVNLVLGKPYAVYRLRVSPDDPHSLLTVQIMADRQGKCGAAQVVHAMNVMCGFEESLGCEDC